MEPDATSSSKAAAARDLLRVVSFRVLNNVQELIDSAGPEAAANAMEPYLAGVLTTLRATSPELIPELRQAIADQACRTAPRDAELMMFAKMTIVDSAVGSPALFDCALNRHKSEDVVLWTVLDAWRSAGQVPSSTITELEERATDERTRRRFLNPEQQRAMRMALDPAGPAAFTQSQP